MAVGRAIRSDPDVRSVLDQWEPQIRNLFNRLAKGLPAKKPPEDDWEVPPDDLFSEAAAEMLKTAGISMEYIEGLNEEPTPAAAPAPAGSESLPDGEYNHFRRRASVGGPVKKKEKWTKMSEEEGRATVAAVQQRVAKWAEEGEPCVPLDGWLTMMKDASENYAHVTLEQESAITGVPPRKKQWELALTEQQVLEAYTMSRNVFELALEGLSLDGLSEALARCGELMYANVDKMSTAQKVRGMLENAMKIADLKTVVRDSTFLKAPPRFDASALLLKEAEVEGKRLRAQLAATAPKAGREVSEEEAEAHARREAQVEDELERKAAENKQMLNCYNVMKLDDIHGYPTWDRVLWFTLKPHFQALSLLYVYYCNKVPEREEELQRPPIEVQVEQSEMEMVHWMTLITDMNVVGADPSEAQRLQWAFLSRTPNYKGRRRQSALAAGPINVATGAGTAAMIPGAAPAAGGAGASPDPRGCCGGSAPDVCRTESLGEHRRRAAAAD